MKLEDIKNRTKDAVDYLVQSLESGRSEVLNEYLGTMARFHTYSFGNVMLIARQKPDATNVIQELLRHSNYKVTADTYTQAVTPIKRAAQTKLVRMILPIKTAAVASN